MYKIGVIGDRESVLGFKAVGLDVFPCDSSEEAKKVLNKVLNKVVKDDYAIIYVTEQLYQDMTEEASEYIDRKLPAIIPVPSKDGTLGIGVQGVKKSVERAVGADILFGGE